MSIVVVGARQVMLFGEVKRVVEGLKILGGGQSRERLATIGGMVNGRHQTLRQSHPLALSYREAISENLVVTPDAGAYNPSNFFRSSSRDDTAVIKSLNPVQGSLDKPMQRTIQY